MEIDYLDAPFFPDETDLKNSALQLAVAHNAGASVEETLTKAKAYYKFLKEDIV